MSAFSAEQTQVLATAFAVEVDETRSHLTKAILRLERGREDNRPVLFAMLTRGLHTLKGSAASIGMSDVSRVAHLLEDAIAPTVTARAALPSEIASLLLAALDAMHETVSARANGTEAAIDIDAWERRAAPKRSDSEDEAAPVSSPAPLSSPSPLASLAARDAEPVEWRITEADVSALAAEASRLVDLAAILKERAEFAQAASAEVVVGDDAAKERLTELAHVLLRDASGLEALAAALADRIETISSVRVGVVVEPLRRLARDQAAATGKRVALDIRGEDLTIHRGMASGLRGALVHLVSNAIVHGIEAPGVRLRQNKAVEGRIGLTIGRSGERICVVVEDDGNGLDFDRIRMVAVRSGLASADTAPSLTEDDLVSLVFRPAFTTKDNVTAAAGRGVGLDAVSASIREMGGTIGVESTAGKGARFVLDLPSH